MNTSTKLIEMLRLQADEFLKAVFGLALGSVNVLRQAGCVRMYKMDMLNVQEHCDKLSEY